MKILAVTGLLAADAVKKSVGGLADVLVLPIPVAALITPQKLISGYQSSEFSNQKYDAVLVSGFCKLNFSKAEEAIGSPVYLGPKHAADLKSVLLLGMFSKTVPACEFIQTQKRAQAFEILKNHEQKETFAFRIGSVSIGGSSRMKVLAEVVAAESLTKDELTSQVHYLISEGADIIDLGFSLDANEQTVASVVSFVKSFCPVPISIDSGSFSQILSGIENGADLVLSVDSDILNEYRQLPCHKHLTNSFDRVSFVVIPDLFEKGGLSKVESLEKNMAAARGLGMKNLIADPILSPPGSDLFLSLRDYYDFHQRNPGTPVLFGVGNVTELFDADSVGMNALLSEIAAECGASLLFTPNAGDKGRGSVRELKTASEMVLLSKIRETTPKDLGIDLLILKEKRKRPDFNLDIISNGGAFNFLHLRDDEMKSDQLEADQIDAGQNEAARSVYLSGALNPNFTAETKWSWKSDPAGNFLIGVLSVSDFIPYLIRSCGFDEDAAALQKLKSVQTQGQRMIVAVHPKAIVAGTDSAFMMETILNENLISELSHAAYLGRELQKAEIAVRLGRSYSQDDAF